MLRSRYIMPFRLGLLPHLRVHGPALRPHPAPVIPTLYTISNALKIIGINTISNKPGRPIVYRALHQLISCHISLLSASRTGPCGCPPLPTPNTHHSNETARPSPRRGIVRGAEGGPTWPPTPADTKFSTA